MTIKEFAADTIRIARAHPMIEHEVFEAGLFKIQDEDHKKIYIQAFRKEFPNWSWKV